MTSALEDNSNIIGFFAMVTQMDTCRRYEFPGKENWQLQKQRHCKNL